DSTAMPAHVHHFYLENFYDKNTFAHGNLSVLETPITLADIPGPVYHVATREDHIAPAASVYNGARQMTGADVRFVLSGSGHIAGVVNPPAAQKYQFWTGADLSAATLEGWMAEAEETPGSWWTDWDTWLAERSGRKVNAREPGKTLGVLEAAPGAYVKVRFDQQ
ncbi:MAG: class I poly(R)-hydroxyalkanoic acid synthase, partial [Pseudomonadota bacterium]